MLKLSILLISFLIGCSVNSLISESGGAEAVRLPIGSTGLLVEVRKTHAHLFLAEYDFMLVLKMGSREIDSKAMTGDTGGLSRIDVLKVAQDRYAFRDHARTVCLDVQERKFDRDCDFRTSGPRIGHFDFDSSKRWRYIAEIDGGF